MFHSDAAAFRQKLASFGQYRTEPWFVVTVVSYLDYQRTVTTLQLDSI